MDQQYQHNHAYDHEDDYHNAINAQNQYADSEAEQIHLEHLKNSGQFYDGGDNHHPDDLQVNDQLRQQMTSFEGMNRLAQLAGELDQHSNSNFQQNNQMNGYGNEAYLPDGHEFIEQQEQQQQQQQQQELYANPNQSRSILGSIPNVNNDNQNHYIENGYQNGPNGHLPHNSNSNINSQHAVDLSKSGIKLEPVTLPPLDNVENALKTLAEIKNTMPEDESIADEINCLSKILSRNEFTETLELYNTTVTNWSSPLGVVTAPPEDKENQSNPVRQPSFKQNIEPLTSATDRLVNEVRNNLSIVYQTEAQNLLRLLYMPNFQVLFPTHDEVALMREGDMNENNIVINPDSDGINHLPNHPSNHDIDEISQGINGIQTRNLGNDLQIVLISKTVEALGATIKNDGDSIIISRIINGGLVDKNGQLHEGDEIIKVNGQEVRGRHVDDVSNMIAANSQSGDIELVIKPCIQSRNSKTERSQEELHVRSLFNYDPFDDAHVPCKELALKFDKGQILHITDRSDKDWWQAFRDGETGITLAGLIPSSSFEEKRQNLLKQFEKAEEDEAQIKTSGFCHRVKKKKDKKGAKRDNINGGNSINETFQTYEKMALYQQPEERKRPIILIGASNVGRQDLRQRLLDYEKHRFQAAVPHTTRPKQEGELNGRDYYFVQKDVFVNDIQEFKFIEHGIYEKHYYGTSLDSIRHIINSGKICIIQLHAPSLIALMKTDLMPFVIFISAPNVETMRDIFANREGRSLTEAEMKDTVEQSSKIEKEYACYFDKTIQLTDLDKTYDELLKTINQLDTQAQWVPQVWLDRL